MCIYWRHWKIYVGTRAVATPAIFRKGHLPSSTLPKIIATNHHYLWNYLTGVIVRDCIGRRFGRPRDFNGTMVDYIHGIWGNDYDYYRVYLFLYSPQLKLCVTEETVLASVIGHGEGQVVRIRLAHDRVGPIVKTIAHFLCIDIVSIDKGKKLGDDLRRRVNTMISKLLYRSWTHARNFIHLEIQQRTVDKFDDSIGTKRTFGGLVIKARHFFNVFSIGI